MLILEGKFEQMQALERVILSENFITILLVIALSLITMLKSLNSEKLKGSIFAIFNTVYIEEEVEDNESFFTAFNLVLFVFSSIIISLIVYKLTTHFYSNVNEGLFYYLKLLSIIFSYFSIKWFLEFLIRVLFVVKNETIFFSIAKSRSLYSITFGFFCLLLVTTYGGLSTNFLLYSSIFLVVIRFFTILLNNKNLIISKLFYFILYLCALEIAPLFVLFKLMF